MIQGSNMTRGHKGMRKGISLLELLIAIVLLGVLASIGFKYYKVFYDTGFAAKQAKIYVLIEQAQQLRGAHQLFDTKNGQVPYSIDDLATDKQLTVVPPVMPEISATGWELWTYQLYSLYSTPGTPQAAADDGNITLAGTTVIENDIAFTLKFDTASTSAADKLDYCNIVNNTGLNTWALNTTLADAETALGGNTPALAYASGDVNTDMFCYVADTNTVDGNLTAVFTVLVDAT